MLTLKWNGVLWQTVLLLSLAVSPVRSESVDTPSQRLEDLPAHLQVTLRDAEASLQAGDWSKAQLDYAQLLREEPDYQRALWGRAAALLRLGRDFEALPLLERVLGSEPTFEELATASRLLDEAARIDPTPDRQNRALEYRRQALDSAESADLVSETPDPRQLAGLILLERDAGRGSEVLDAYDRLGDQAPHLLIAELVAANESTSPAVWNAQNTTAPVAPPDDGAWDHVELFLVAVVAIGLGWAVGLLVLFMLGKGLSVLVLRWIDRDRTSGPIPFGQRWARRVYALVIGLAGLYYYISLLVVLAIVLAAPGSLFYGLATTSQIPGWTLWAALPVCLIVVVLALPMVRSLRVQLVENAPGRPLAIDEAPRLWALTREVAEAVGTRPVDEIRVTGGVGIAVSERGRRRQVLRGRGRRSLLLGMGTFDDFAPTTFGAVLAHEYGHFLHGDTAGGQLARRINAQMVLYACSILEWRGDAWWNVGWHFLRFYQHLFRQITLGAVRLQELHADGIMMRVGSPGEAAEGLRHMVRSEGRYQRAMENRFNRALFGPRLLVEPLRLQLAIDNRCIRTFYEMVINAPMLPDDTHPSLSSRLARFDAGAANANAKSNAFHENKQSCYDIDMFFSGLWDQFHDPERIRAEYRRRFDAELQARLDSHAAYHDQVIAACNIAIADASKAPFAYFHRAQSYSAMGDDQSAIADYSAAIEHAPTIADPYISRAFSLLRSNRPVEAIADIEKAIRLAGYEFEPTGRSLLGDIHARSGQFDRAVEEYSQALELLSSCPEWLLKRGRARLGLKDSEAALADFRNALELDPESVEALIGCGEAHLALGHFKTARQDVEKALKIDPFLVEAHLLLSSLLETDPDPKARDLARARQHRRWSESLGRRIVNVDHSETFHYA